VAPEPAVRQLVQDEVDVEGAAPRDPRAELGAVLPLAQQAGSDPAVGKLDGTGLVRVVDAGSRELFTPSKSPKDSRL
jgi:hypothetical protein